MTAKPFILIAALAAGALNAFAQTTEVKSKLGVPFGKLVTLEGVVINGPYKGPEGGKNLLVQKINGRATQEIIRVPLRRFRGERYDPPEEWVRHDSFEIMGYASGGFTGLPADVSEKIWSETESLFAIGQTTGFYFLEEFVGYSWKKIPPVTFTPLMFKDQAALFSGRAKSRDGQGLMQGDGWSVVVLPGSPWPKHIEGKRVETLGTYALAAESNRFNLIGDDWWLVNLGDQVGRYVALRGRARSLNGEWWFHYRGIDLYVEDIQKLPDWGVDNHWCPMVIKGRLEKETLPRIDQISLKEERDLKEYFIVKNASWEPLGALLSPEEEPFLGELD